MSEAKARAEVAARSGGVCELTGARADEMSHRLARSHVGLWRPSNLLHLCARTHRWLHEHPAAAYAGGWHVRDGDDPRQVPVWLACPYPGWFLIDDVPGDGGPHLLVPADVDLPAPRMPFAAAVLQPS